MAPALIGALHQTRHPNLNEEHDLVMQSEQLDTGVRVHSESSFFGRFAGSSSQVPPHEQDEFFRRGTIAE
jgi:hypothetical protein